MVNFGLNIGVHQGLYCDLEMQQSNPKSLPTILIVDEEPDVVQTLSLRLWFAGYRVLCALDGSTAMHLALKERPDLVVLDVRMLEEDGNTIARRLRTHPRCTHIPTIGIDEVEATWHLNPAGYVEKVSGSDALLARIMQAVPPGPHPTGL